MAKTVTRRYWICNARATKALTVDVRTGEGVSEAQARANAESLAEKKLGTETVFVRSIAIDKTKPNFSIGPRN